MERMIEKAKEELQMLETQHPNRFDYLKLELKSFISLLQSQLFIDHLPTTSATTQGFSFLSPFIYHFCPDLVVTLLIQIILL